MCLSFFCLYPKLCSNPLHRHTFLLYFYIQHQLGLDVIQVEMDGPDCRDVCVSAGHINITVTAAHDGVSTYLSGENVRSTSYTNTRFTQLHTRQPSYVRSVAILVPLVFIYTLLLLNMYVYSNVTTFCTHV